jgi:hypothetical protein
MNIHKITCSLIFAAAILATTGCPNPGSQVMPQLQIGEIKGTISWRKDEGVPNPSVISDAIGITPVTVEVVPPPNGGTFGSTKITKVKNENVDVVFGSPSGSGSLVTVTYTVSKLPLDTLMQLEVKQKQPIPGTFIGTFERDGDPLSAICVSAEPTVSQFNFHAVPPPH